MPYCITAFFHLARNTYNVSKQDMLQDAPASENNKTLELTVCSTDVNLSDR